MLSMEPTRRARSARWMGNTPPRETWSRMASLASSARLSSCVQLLGRLGQLVVALGGEALHHVLQLLDDDHHLVDELAHALEHLLLALPAHGVDDTLQGGLAPEESSHLATKRESVTEIPLHPEVEEIVESGCHAGAERQGDDPGQHDSTEDFPADRRPICWPGRCR